MARSNRDCFGWDARRWNFSRTRKRRATEIIVAALGDTPFRVFRSKKVDLFDTRYASKCSVSWFAKLNKIFAKRQPIELHRWTQCSFLSTSVHQGHAQVWLMRWRSVFFTIPSSRQYCCKAQLLLWNSWLESHNFRSSVSLESEDS